MNPESVIRTAQFSEQQVPNYNVSSIGELIPKVLDVGERRRKIGRKSRKKLSPTNSERMNRSLVELGPSAFKIHMLLWQWRGAPARGLLPFFTIHSLSRFCGLSRPTVRTGLMELVAKGWIRRERYNARCKNSLYRLVPVRDIPISV